MLSTARKCMLSVRSLTPPEMLSRAWMIPPVESGVVAARRTTPFLSRLLGAVYGELF